MTHDVADGQQILCNARQVLRHFTVANGVIKIMVRTVALRNADYGVMAMELAFLVTPALSVVQPYV
jgi:hypothetical protein